MPVPLAVLASLTSRDGYSSMPSSRSLASKLLLAWTTGPEIWERGVFNVPILSRPPYGHRPCHDGAIITFEASVVRRTAVNDSRVNDRVRRFASASDVVALCPHGQNRRSLHPWTAGYGPYRHRPVPGPPPVNPRKRRSVLHARALATSLTVVPQEGDPPVTRCFMIPPRCVVTMVRGISSGPARRLVEVVLAEAVVTARLVPSLNKKCGGFRSTSFIECAGKCLVRSTSVQLGLQQRMSSAARQRSRWCSVAGTPVLMIPGLSGGPPR